MGFQRESELTKGGPGVGAGRFCMYERREARTCPANGQARLVFFGGKKESVPACLRRGTYE